MAGNRDGDEGRPSTARLSGVGVTAVGVAWARAAESRRPDRLFDDPLAAVVVERGQRELAVMFGVDEDDPTEKSPFDEQTTSIMLEHIAVRTRYFDDYLLEACAAGCRQVVILAAGMDARAFRLPWPAGTRLYELDRPEVLAYKEDVVAARGVLPRCERRPVAPWEGFPGPTARWRSSSGARPPSPRAPWPRSLTGWPASAPRCGPESTTRPPGWPGTAGGPASRTPPTSPSATAGG